MEWELVLGGLVSVILVAVVGLLLWRSRLQLPMEPPIPGLPPGPADIFAAALARTRDALGGMLGNVFTREKVDDSAYDALEEALLKADLGPRTTLGLLEELRKQVATDAPADRLRQVLKKLVLERLKKHPTALATVPTGPLVILVVGVNGSGKTTTIGKLAARYKKEGKSVLLGAGDTFRAGAIEQLKVWGERAGVDVIASQEGSDPAAVIHDTLQAARARGSDVVICDTAGRLQAHKALMDELGKIKRVITKIIPDAPHEVLLVLDGTMGQNALSQAKIFREVAGVTGVVITKLDGTARGGVIIAIADEHGLPIKLVGVGEKTEDLRDFEPEAFVQGIFGA